MDNYYYEVHLKAPILINGYDETYILDFDKMCQSVELMYNGSIVAFYDTTPEEGDTLAIIPVSSILTIIRRKVE